jgi:hypothetical protein
MGIPRNYIKHCSRKKDKKSIINKKIKHNYAYNSMTNIFDNWDWSLTPNELRNTIRLACYKYFNENHSSVGKLFKQLEAPYKQAYNEQ